MTAASSVLTRPAEPKALPASVASPKAEPKLAIRDVGFRYGETVALKGVTLDVPANQVTGLVGPSGCGKSTLLRILNRLYDMNPDQVATGEVLLDGTSILGPLVDLRRLRSRVGMVFQESTILPMSIRGNISFGIDLHEKLSRADMAQRVEAALHRAALWGEVKDRLSGPASILSIGQQQRLCIARALAIGPDVLLLDEPTSALDPRSTEAIEALIATLKQHVTIVLITHNLQQGARCADQVAFLYLGEMVECGTSEQIFTAPKHKQTQAYVAGRFG